MSRLTRGPLPARVYWRRRVLVLGSALLLVFAIARLLGAGSDASSDPEAQQVAADQSPSATATTPALGVPSDSVTLHPGKHDSAQAPVLAEPTGPCADQDISVSPEAKDPVAGRDVEIVLHLRTIEAEACTWEVSPKTLTMKITSGADDIWSTRQCPRAVPDQQVVVRRDTATSLKMTWPDARRSDDQCSVHAGWALPGYYHVEVAALAGEPAEEQFKLEAPTGQVITRSPSPQQSPHQTPSGRPVVSSSRSSSPSSSVD